MTPIRHVRLSLVALSCSLLMIAGLSWPGAARSQGASIEELEQRLQKAKEEKARRDAAAAKAKSNADAAKPRTEPVERANARLVVSTDAPCALAVNGNAMGELRPGAARMVEVLPGQQLVECASAAEPAVSVRATPSVNAASQQVVDLRLVPDLERAASQAQTRNQAVQVAQRLVGRWEAASTKTAVGERLQGSYCDGRYSPGGMRCDYSTCTIRTDMRAWLEIEADKAGPPHQLTVRYQRANNVVVTGQYEQWPAGTRRSENFNFRACSTAAYFADAGQARWMRNGSFTAAVGQVAGAYGPLTTVECSGNCGAESQKSGFRDTAELRFNGDRIELWFDGSSEAAFSFARK